MALKLGTSTISATSVVNGLMNLPERVGDEIYEGAQNAKKLAKNVVLSAAGGLRIGATAIKELGSDFVNFTRASRRNKAIVAGGFISAIVIGGFVLYAHPEIISNLINAFNAPLEAQKAEAAKAAEQTDYVLRIYENGRFSVNGILDDTLPKYGFMDYQSLEALSKGVSAEQLNMHGLANLNHVNRYNGFPNCTAQGVLNYYRAARDPATQFVANATIPLGK